MRIVFKVSTTTGEVDGSIKFFHRMRAHPSMLINSAETSRSGVFVWLLRPKVERRVLRPRWLWTRSGMRCNFQLEVDASPVTKRLQHEIWFNLVEHLFYWIPRSQCNARTLVNPSHLGLFTDQHTRIVLEGKAVEVIPTHSTTGQVSFTIRLRTRTRVEWSGSVRVNIFSSSKNFPGSTFGVKIFPTDFHLSKCVKLRVFGE